ncbi:Abhydrolase domain-containing protein [Ceratobasidium sp. AG-Ba]|nr:Abhydrolase domain-containing protein [Ceratobasidium sp. AG-Ba]
MHPIVPILSCLSTLAAATPWPLPTDFHRFAPRQSGIQWKPCGQDSNSTLECGRFEVPLDYAHEAAGKASLFVARYPATKQPKLGTLFLNPGGPGESGANFVANDVIMNTVGGQYDLVSWDPRGVGNSVPLAECFANASEEEAFWKDTIPRTGLEARSNFTHDPADLQAFYGQVAEVDRVLTDFGKKCVEYSPNTFQYLGSVAAVRDMIALHDLLEGADKPLNYWGFSYGTVIGIYFVNMFPNRVGRVVIDGVVDPVYWANLPPYEMWSINAESTDEALTGFVTACAAAGPTGCAIASEGSTPDSLRDELRRMIDLAYDYKKSNGTSAEFGSATIRRLLFKGMYFPAQWPQLAQTILPAWNFLTNNGTLTKRTLSLPEKRQTNATEKASVYGLQSITCADAIDAGNTTTRDVFDEMVRVTRDVSQMFGPAFEIGGFYCHRWPVRAVERYTGPWNKKLANPILVIGNEADPVTPYRSAKSVADALGDSAILVEQDDYGHASLAMHSDCTFKILSSYFLEGQLPSTDQFCGTNQQLFPGPGVTKSYLAALSASNSNSTSDLQSQVEQEKNRARQLLIGVIGLTVGILLLLVWLFWPILFEKKSGRGQKDRLDWGNEESGEGHMYKTPYDDAAAQITGGRYVPVQT